MFLARIGPLNRTWEAIEWMIRRARRDPQEELARTILNQIPCGMELHLPPMPSIEFTLDPEGMPETGRHAVTRGRGHITETGRTLAVLETTDGRLLGIINAPKPPEDQPFRNSDELLYLHLTLALDTSAWKLDPRGAPDQNDPVAARRLMHQCVWLRAGPLWATEWRRYSANHHEYDNGGKPRRNTEQGWALCRNGVLLLKYPLARGRDNYPEHVILEVPGNQYVPVDRTIRDTGIIVSPTHPMPGEKPGERTIKWRGQETDEWENPVRQLYEHHGWRAGPGCERNDREPRRHFTSVRHPGAILGN